MGVINLGALVEKLKKKLVGAGFITKTDYASSSAGGVIKTDSTYATDITSGGKLKSTTIAAASYSDANSAAFISKGTLDALITAGTIGGGGMTWTKLFEGAASSSDVKTLIEGQHLLSHKLIIISTWTSVTDCAFAILLPEILPADQEQVRLTFTRSDGARTIIFTDTGFTMPNNMNVANMVIYGLD